MADDKMERRLAAVLAADVAGYSRLMGEDEEGTLTRLKVIRKALVDPTITSHRGRIVKTTGDGMLIEFASAVDAVRGALEVQRGMREQNAEMPQDKRIEFRIGIHVGDIIIDENDIFGDGVNIAARLEGIAEPGGLCVSDDAYRQVRGKVEIAWDDLGTQTLKNIAEPMRAWRNRLDGRSSATAQSALFTTQARTLALPDKPSIAVLPFENMSGDPEQDYFADGIVEDIITALSKFKSLFVIARNSSFTYKGKAVDIRQVGRELGVRYVLEGSVRRSSNRVRVTGQLLEATTDKHLWADKFDGLLEDVFDLQDRITATVVGLIAPQIEEAEIARARRKSTNSLDSYDCYLRGLAHYYKREWADAREMFANALELDPEFAAAYAMAAVTDHMQQGAGGQPLTTEMRAEALRLANIGAQLGNEDAFVLARCGHTLVYLGNEFDRGAAMVEKALSLNPNLATARASLGWISVITCDPKRAIDNFQSTIRLNPLDMMRVGSTAGIAWGLWLQGRYDEGLTLAKSVATIHPHVQAFGSLLANCVAAGKIEEARAAAAELIKLDPDFRASRAHEIFPLRNAEYRSRLEEALRVAGLPE